LFADLTHLLRLDLGLKTLDLLDLVGLKRQTFREKELKRVSRIHFFG
jgi:hypothetical protein